MFEQLVRPFQTRQVTTTKRIIPVKSEAAPQTAIISWGAAGTLPEGVVQPSAVDLESIESIGFQLHSCTENWTQADRVGEESQLPIKTTGGAVIGNATVDRTKEITFRRREAEVQPFSFAAVGVTQVISGLRTSIPGSNSCESKFKLSYTS